MADFRTSRRELLLRGIPMCSLCFGLTRLNMAAAALPDETAIEKKAAEKAEFTYAELFSFAYRDTIPVLQNLCDQIGNEKGLEMIRKAAYDVAFESMAKRVEKVPVQYLDLPTFISRFRNPSVLWRHALTYEIIKDNEKESEIRVTECLWAKTYRQLNAAGLGYALHCVTDEATVKAYNSKISLNRPSLLMRGDSECRYFFRMES